MTQNKLDRALNLSVFLVVMASLFFAYTYPKVLPKHPQSVHQWRQCDGASIAMMYLHNGLNPFKPSTYNQHGEGKTVAEFPIIYYIDACVISIVGVKYKDFVIRFVNLLILYLGLFYLFKIGLFFFKNRWKALLPVVFLHSSPVVAYYAATSVPDSSALAFAIIGIYCLIRYIDGHRLNYLLFAVIATALSGMIKPTILISYLSFLCFLVVTYIYADKRYQLPIKSYAFLLTPILATILWVVIARAYNAYHTNITFLLDVKPIWDLERAFIDKISLRIKEVWIKKYIYVPMLWFILSGSFLFLIIPNKKYNFIKVGLAALMLGTVAYFYLFFKQFYEHDYYGIELLPMILVFFMVVIYWISNANYSKVISSGFLIFTSALLVLNVYSTRKSMIKRYQEDIVWNAYYDEYLELGPKLREIGIMHSDKVLVGSDISPNISLYLMDQLGWTKFPYGLNEALLKDHILKGAKYLIVSEADFPMDAYLLPYANDLVLEHKQLSIYNLDSKQ